MKHKGTILVLFLYVTLAHCVDYYVYDDLSSYTGAGFAPGGASGKMDSNKWIIGALAYGGSDSSSQYAAGRKSASSPEIGASCLFDSNQINSFGFLPTAGVLYIIAEFMTTGNIQRRVLNTWGQTVTSVTITVEIWDYNGGNAQQLLNPYYKVGSASEESLPSSFSTRLTATNNLRKTSVPYVITGISWAPNTYFNMRWAHSVTSGSGYDSISFYNFTMVATVPDTTTTTTTSTTTTSTTTTTTSTTTSATTSSSSSSDTGSTSTSTTDGSTVGTSSSSDTASVTSSTSSTTGDNSSTDASTSTSSSTSSSTSDSTATTSDTVAGGGITSSSSSATTSDTTATTGTTSSSSSTSSDTTSATSSSTSGSISSTSETSSTSSPTTITTSGSTSISSSTSASNNSNLGLTDIKSKSAGFLNTQNILIIAVVGGVIVLGCIVAVILLIIFRKGPKRGKGPKTALRDVYDIKILELLGDGNFGEVFRGMWQGTTEVALKKLRNQDDFNQFANEAAILQSISHPNCVTFFGIYTDAEGYKYIVTEYMSKGSLMSVIHKEGKQLNEIDLLSMAKHAAAGLRYLEQQKIIHRDIALRNILVTLYGSDNKFLVKVADFGLARTIDKGLYTMNSGKIPIRWCSPETLRYGVYDSKCDVYAFGVLLWELFSYGQLPYGVISNEEIQEKVLAGYRLPAPDNTPPEIVELMQKCWAETPEDRPQFSDIFSVIDRALIKYREEIELRVVDQTIVKRDHPMKMRDLEGMYDNQRSNNYSNYSSRVADIDSGARGSIYNNVAFPSSVRGSITIDLYN